MVASPFWPAWSAVADVTHIGPGVTILDVGCGTGGFCELASARGGVVHGVDGLVDRIDQARRRVPDGDFRVGLIEMLPWPDDSFDLVTGFNAFQYAFDVDSALTEARRVARPGGRIVVCKWDRPEHNEFFAFLGTLGARDVDLTRLPAVDPVDEAMERVGLEDLSTGDVPAVLEMADDAALEAALSSAGILSGPGVCEAARRRIATAASPFRRPDGSYRFANRLRYRIARA